MKHEASVRKKNRKRFFLNIYPFFISIEEALCHPDDF